jgi:hypothetical protein
MKERELKLIEATNVAKHKADELSKALELLEERAKQDEAERAARELLLSSGSSRLAVSTTAMSLQISNAHGAEGPLDSDTVVVNGKQWRRMWDAGSSAHYWFCEDTKMSQWDNPLHSLVLEDGYESSGALTDYSTDHDESMDESSLVGGDLEEWQEFWDEVAQSKYWYNNLTVSAYMLHFYAICMCIIGHPLVLLREMLHG